VRIWSIHFSVGLEFGTSSVQGSKKTEDMPGESVTEEKKREMGLQEEATKREHFLNGPK